MRKYCRYCGFKLEREIETCPRCGKVLAINRTAVMREDDHSEWKNKEPDEDIPTEVMDKNEAGSFFSAPGDL